MSTLLIAGGAEDTQLEHLSQAAKQEGRAVALALMDEPLCPSLEWRIDQSGPSIQNKPLDISAAFVRQDVFKYLRTNSETVRRQARSWKIFFDGWLWSRPDIKIFNRDFLMRDEVNKPLALCWAQEAGLTIPRTEIHASKHAAERWLESDAVVYKPIGGGDLCRELTSEALNRVQGAILPYPYIFQERLIAPEIRIFRIGEAFLAFQVETEGLDYRDEQLKRPKLTPVDPPRALLTPLRGLTDRLGLTYTAADFKTSQRTGELCFLEANSNPMFAAFDIAADGALTRTMLDWLLEPSKKPKRF